MCFSPVSSFVSEEFATHTGWRDEGIGDMTTLVERELLHGNGGFCDRSVS
jgi:hypothetical protein